VSIKLALKALSMTILNLKKMGALKKPRTMQMPSLKDLLTAAKHSTKQRSSTIKVEQAHQWADGCHSTDGKLESKL